MEQVTPLLRSLAFFLHTIETATEYTERAEILRRRLRRFTQIVFCLLGVLEMSFL